MQTWYLVQCKNNNELRAHQSLRSDGRQSVLPQVLVDKVLGDDGQAFGEPMFRNLLLVCANETTDLNALRQTRGVADIVKVNGEPVEVSAIVEALLHCRHAHLPGLQNDTGCADKRLLNQLKILTQQACSVKRTESLLRMVSKQTRLH
ncbi:transcription termination/antitermination NusG family protein [Paraferrimonas sedimenticola]|nr:transcription termination/antitermination NusG family protein [Paraferrimonas sedimenticola]